MPEPEELIDFAYRWDSVVQAVESAGLALDGGLLVAPAEDSLDPSLDPDMLATVRSCIDAINGQLSSGEIALADIGVEDDGSGQAVAVNTWVDGPQDGVA